MCMYHLAYLLLLAEGCNISLSAQNSLQVRIVIDVREIDYCIV